VISKRTVFILGAGASCPYGFPSGARLRDLICFDGGFRDKYLTYLTNSQIDEGIRKKKISDVKQFIKIFNNSHIKSIDAFMANNPKLSLTGKYILAYEIFQYEIDSRFGEDAIREQERLEGLRKSPDNNHYLWGIPGFNGGDWYFYLYNRMVEGLVGKYAIPDFSNGNISFITFNYDRSLEQFFYISLRNSFSEVSEEEIIKTLKQLKILHVYGQVAFLKWQNPSDYIEYKQTINESHLERSSKNIRTIYEEKENPELLEAQKILKQADQIFFLGFGYAPENMEVLNLPGAISNASKICGTAFVWEEKEIERVKERFVAGFKSATGKWVKPSNLKIENTDCLKLLINYLD
jgi:hypothetical protein